MPIPIIAWAIGAAVAAAGTAVAAYVISEEENNQNESSVERTQKKLDAEAEQKRKEIKDKDAINFTQNKLKAFIQKYELAYSYQSNTELDSLIRRIAEDGSHQSIPIGLPIAFYTITHGIATPNKDIKEDMMDKFLASPKMLALLEKVEAENEIIRQVKISETYLKKILEE